MCSANIETRVEYTRGDNGGVRSRVVDDDKA